MHYDLTNASVDDVARFAFDHEPVDRMEDQSSQSWYWTEEFTVAVDPARQLALTTELLSSAGQLRWKYSEEQLDQGLWFMFGPGGEEWFAGLVGNEELPLHLRVRFITSIYTLYEQLLSDAQLEGSATFMLWDLLIYQFLDGDDFVVPAEFEAAMFDTLCRILDLPDLDCQHAALHGLGHLRHRDTGRVVADYLARSEELPKELAEYATRVRDGDEVL